ncbi:hypothetical protein [Arthrobacter sp. 260]|uniref:hypothetical protein n=1 Tax=Arthrobacter sp. 260 TaxID=2735314 RepID=UPI001491D4E2|nr:hypothetical protein [Arthrobacter sp. 260]NOJ59770.1 hypothetical protein [Arthrobacter sp. 260]
MSESSRLLPEDPFPEDLSELEKVEVEVLNSRVHRELDAEYFEDDGPQPATQDRLEEIQEELDRRDGVGPQRESVTRETGESVA